MAAQADTYAIAPPRSSGDEGAMLFATSLLGLALLLSALSLIFRAVGSSCLRQLSLFALRLTTVLHAVGMFLVAVMLLCIWLNVLLSLLDFASAPATLLELPRGFKSSDFWGFSAFCALASFSVVLARFMCWAFVAAGGSFGVMYTVTRDLDISPGCMSDEFGLLRCLHVTGRLDFGQRWVQAVFVVLSLGAGVMQVAGPQEPSAEMVLLLSGAPIWLMSLGVLVELVMCTWNTITGKHVKIELDHASEGTTNIVHNSSSGSARLKSSSQGVEEGAARVSEWGESVYTGWEEREVVQQEPEVSDAPIQKIIKLHYGVFAVNCLIGGVIAASQSQGLSSFIGEMLIRLLFVSSWNFSVTVIGARVLGLFYVQFNWPLIWGRWFNPPKHPAYSLNKDGSLSVRKVLANTFDVGLFGFCLFVAPIMFCAMVYSAGYRSLLGDFVIACLFLISIFLCPMFLMLAHEGYLRATRSVYVFFAGCQHVTDDQQRCGEGVFAVLCCTRDPTKEAPLFPRTSRLDELLRKSFTKAFGTSVMLILFVVICFLVFWGPLAKGYDSAKGEPLKMKEVDSPVLTEPTYAPYKICDTRWFEADLDVYDLAMFANIAYGDDKSTEEFLTRGYPNWIRENTETHSRVRYQVFVHNITQEHLITVRGTELAADWFQNAQLWGEASVYQMTIGQIFAPPLVSVKSVQRIVKATAFMQEAFGSGYHNVYWKPVLAELNKLKAMYPTDKLLVTGHSLGGGVAKISGIKASVRSVAFNAPGLLYSASKLRLHTNDINANVVNVRSETDAISAIDLLGGQVQTIKCFDADADWLSCHAILNQAAELQAACNFENKTIWTDV